MSLHRLPHDHDLVPPWHQVVALGVLTLAVCGLGASLTLVVWDINALWWLPAAPGLQWFGMRYVAGRGGGGYVPREENPDDSPTLRLAAVEAHSPDPGPGTGPHRFSGDLDRPATARHALTEEYPMPKPVPTPRNPAQAVLPADRFEPFSVAQVTASALALQTTRWNFTLIRKMQPHQAAKQFGAMNRYLREQVLQEAHAALKAGGAPVWPAAEPEVPAGARDDAAEVDDFWNRKMEVLIDWFNPPDEDAACESIVLDAVERAYKFAQSQPCQCPEGFDEDDEFDACQRCQVLGRVRDQAVQR